MASSITYTSLFGGPIGQQQDTAPTSEPAPAARRRREERQERSQPWTASRCHRLLRPLLSHITALRKENARGLLNNTTDATAAATTVGPGKRGRPANDLPQRKKIRYTYSLKASQKNRIQVAQRVDTESSNGTKRYSAPISGTEQLVLPTPVVRRVRGHPASSPLQPKSPSTTNTVDSSDLRNRSTTATRSSLHQELSMLQAKTPPARYALYESIFRATEALLRTTLPVTSEPNSRSLMSMCLRKVPMLIAGLEEWERHEAEANGTKSSMTGYKVSSEMYGDLESLGAVNGWNHLRSVVRADGARMLRDAILEGLFNMSFARVLLKLYRGFAAHVEAEMLLEALTSRQYPEPSGPHSIFTSSGHTEPLQILLEYSNKSGRKGFLFKQLTSMLSQGLIPANWLITPAFGDIWTSVTRAIATSSTSEEAIGFATTVLSILSSQNPVIGPASGAETTKSASGQTLVSAVASLTAMAVLGLETLSDSPEIGSGSRIHAICTRISYILHASLEETSTRRREVIKTKRSILHHALYFMMGLNHDDPSTGHLDLQNAIQNDWTEALRDGVTGDRWKQQYDSLIELVCSTASCCGRAALATPAHTYLEQLLGRLEPLEVLQDHTNQVRADAAFMLADRTADMRDLMFAEGLNAMRTPARKRDDKPPSSRKALFAGYRWEGGLSEWVTATPLVRKHGKVLPSSPMASRDEWDVALETPLRGGCRFETASSPTSMPSNNAEVDGQSCASSEDEDDAGTSPETSRRHRAPRVVAPRRSWRGTEQQDDEDDQVEIAASSHGALRSLVPGDELSEEQENRRTVQKPRGKITRSRSSLQDRPPLRSLINLVGVDGQDSDDELGL